MIMQRNQSPPPSRRHLLWHAAVTGAMLLFPTLLLGAPEPGEFVKLGAGSYSTHRPAPCKALPDTIYKTAAFKGAMPTDQWRSSVAWKPLSQNLFPHPLDMVCVPEGLAVSYPGSDVRGGSGNIMDWHRGFRRYLLGRQTPRQTRHARRHRRSGGRRRAATDLPN